MTGRSYLDWNATAPLRPDARSALAVAIETFGNPSSVHGEGRAARQLVEKARQQVAELVSAELGNVMFTSGGTEANMLALSPAWQIRGAPKCDRLLVSAIEHPSVAAGGRFPPELVERIPVTGNGVIDLARLENQLARGGRPLVSIMMANNETGVIQPIGEAAALVRRAGGLLHVDAVQAAGRVAVDLNVLGADLVTISGHKIGAPKAIGALIRRDEALHLPDPLIKGGGQERGLRAGTENVTAIAAFGAAAAAAKRDLSKEQVRCLELRDRLESGLRAIARQTVIFGTAAERVANTVLFAVPGIMAETALIALDLDGVAVSSGSACSSGKVGLSHVLSAMGVAPELARGAIRVSFGYSTAEREIDHLLRAWRKHVETLPKVKHGIAA